MAAYVVCSCCGTKIRTTPADVGRAVVCPVSRRIVLVNAEDVRHAPDAPARRPRRRWAVVLLLLLLVLAGLGGFVAWDWFGRPGLDRETADARPEEKPAGGATPAGTPAAGRPQGEPGTPPTVVITRLFGRPIEVTKKPEPGSPPTVVITPVVVPVPAPFGSPRTPNPSGVAAVPVPVPVGPSPSPTPVPAPPTSTPVPSVTAPAAGPATVARTTPATSAAPVETTRRDARGLAVYELPKRIDRRTADELQRELLAIREVSLDTPAAPRTAQLLFEYGVFRRTSGQVYPGPAIAAKGRPDLAGLPFRLGPDAVLFKDKAEALNALSGQLRVKVQECIPAGRTDPRPDPDRLYAALLAGETGLFRERRWATAEAVPCIQQMLQADGPDVRRMSVELLRGIDSAAATEALVRWAVFDVDPGNRAVAVDALRARDRAAVAKLLVALVRYPWPRAAEHAAEALVALDCRDAVPQLAALLALPDPDAAHAPELSGSAVRFRREVVRVNHARNCLMCHPPSPVATDLVRGAIPDQDKPLPPPTTPAYYNGSNQFVAASTTYLRQDFSVVQPVPNPRLWPEYQRYDYLIGVYPAKDGPAAGAASAYRLAVLFALRELAGRDLGTTADAWAAVRGSAVPPDDRLIAYAGWYLALVANPEVVITFWVSEFGPTFLSLTPAEQAVVLARFRRTYGVEPTRYAVIAYLERVAVTGDPAARARATELLTVYRGEAPGATAAAVEVDPDVGVALSLLRSKDPQVRAAAAAALGLLGAKARPHYKVLVLLLADPDADVRAAVAAALGELTAGPDDLFDALAKATADPNPRVRLAAAEALVKLKLLPRSAARPLAEGLVRKGEWESAAQKAAFEKACAGLLADMKGRASGAYGIILLVAAGDTPSDVPAAIVARLLASAGTPDKDQLGVLVGLLVKPEYRGAAEAQLVDAGDAAVPPLVRALSNDDAKVRAAAATVLGKAASLKNPAATRAGYRAAMDALATAKASDPSPDVRAAAAAALVTLSEAP